jgi:hypothetical protein
MVCLKNYKSVWKKQMQDPLGYQALDQGVPFLRNILLPLFLVFMMSTGAEY